MQELVLMQSHCYSTWRVGRGKTFLEAWQTFGGKYVFWGTKQHLRLKSLNTSHLYIILMRNIREIILDTINAQETQAYSLYMY